MPKVRLHRQLARWVVALALAAPLTALGIGSPVPALSAAAPLGATVSVLALPVEVASTDPGALFAPAIDGQTLFEGDTVRTGPGGMALVTFFDGSESQLGGESQVQIEQVRANPAPQIALLQTAGVTVNHVIPMPAEGSFRTDTPAATGLVRGTSYVVVIGPVGTCGVAGDQPCSASIILLTDRNGHVGRVDVAASGSGVAPVQLTRAGDAAATSNLVATSAHIDPAALAHLESVAHVRNDQAASLTTEQDARAIAATLVPVAPGDGATLGSHPDKPSETVSMPDATAGPDGGPPHATADDRPTAPHESNAPSPPAVHTADSSAAGHATAPAAPASTASSQSAPVPGHADPVAPPKKVIPLTTIAPPHADTSNASDGSNSGKSVGATTAIKPPKAADPVKPAKVVESAATQATSGNGKSNDSGKAANSDS